jgi:hypothetical protein
MSQYIAFRFVRNSSLALLMFSVILKLGKHEARPFLYFTAKTSLQVITRFTNQDSVYMHTVLLIVTNDRFILDNI